MWFFITPREKMLLIPEHHKNKYGIKLLGAVQISGESFFVYKNKDGEISLRTGQEEKIQKNILKNMIKLNPRILRLLSKYRIKPNINTRTLKELTGGHMNDTCKIAMGIYSLLASNLKSGIDEKSIKEASMLHDLGKVLIPSKVLNKPAKLSVKERKIMNIHSTISYELLKTQDINTDTLDLVKYHHQNLKHSGYPKLRSAEHISDIGVQIISTADKYSALREARVYRRKLSRIESLLILYKEVLEGKIHKDVYRALFDYVQKYDKAA